MSKKEILFLICAGFIIIGGMSLFAYTPNKNVNTPYVQNDHRETAWEKLELGMTKAQVRTVWGNRMYETFKHNSEGTQEEWYYRMHLGNAIILTFKDDALVEWRER